MKYDVVVIGGGLGGLTAGAKLAKEGKKVLLLEQHDRPGGYATTFKRGDFTLEVGLHEADGPGPADMKSKIFKELGVFDQVEFLPLPEFYRFVNGRVDLSLPHDPVVAAEKLIAYFPGEEAGIRAYFEQLLNPAMLKAAGGVDQSLGDFLDAIIHNEDLKLVLLGNLGYYHDDPYTLSLAYYTMAQRSYYKNAASFIKGGSQQLSNYLSAYIRQQGGEVQLNCLVTAIQTNNDKAVSLRYLNKKDPQASLQQVEADVFVAGSPLPELGKLLPEGYQAKLDLALQEQRNGASLLSLYLGFDKPLRELGHKVYSTFIYDSSVRSQKDILRNNQAGFDTRSFTFVDYGQIDSGLAPEGKSVGAICCIDYLRDWEEFDRKTYLAKKKEVASILIDRLDLLIPGLKKHIVYSEVGTPHTLKRYTLNPAGAVYGFAQHPGRQLPDLSILPTNLYIGSAWSRTGGGFSGAIMGGYLCALQVIRKRPQQ